MARKGCAATISADTCGSVEGPTRKGNPLGYRPSAREIGKADPQGPAMPHAGCTPFSEGGGGASPCPALLRGAAQAAQLHGGAACLFQGDPLKELGLCCTCRVHRSVPGSQRTRG